MRLFDSIFGRSIKINNYIFGQIKILFVCCFSIFIGNYIKAQDTIVNRIRFNMVEYYENGKLKILANKDSVLNGKCIYFKHNGDTLAKGAFKRGYKIGEWVYFKRKNKKIYLDFGPNLNRKFHEEIYKRKKLVIIDSWHQSSHCLKEYRNGKLFREDCF